MRLRIRAEVEALLQQKGRDVISPSPSSPGPLFDYVPPRAAAEARRELGIEHARAGAAHRDAAFEQHALDAIARFARARAGETFLAEDVRAAAGTPAGIDPKAWGPVFRLAARRGLIVAAGYGPASSSNRSPKVLWRLAPPVPDSPR